MSVEAVAKSVAGSIFPSSTVSAESVRSINLFTPLWHFFVSKLTFFIY